MEVLWLLVILISFATTVCYVTHFITLLLMIIMTARWIDIYDFDYEGSVLLFIIFFFT